MGKIILLNGCGSAGKSQLARSIQHLSTEPWLHLGLDVLFDMMPPKYHPFGEKTQDGVAFIPGENARGALMQVEVGPWAKQVFHCMPEIVKILADNHNNIIVDEVLFGDQLLQTYLQQLHAHTVYFVGVFCDLQTMQEREILRGDRAIGLSNDQMDKVHLGMREYDLKVDSTNKSPFNLAKEILNYMRQIPQPKGFTLMRDSCDK